MDKIRNFRSILEISDYFDTVINSFEKLINERFLQGYLFVFIIQINGIF